MQKGSRAGKSYRRLSCTSFLSLFEILHACTRISRYVEIKHQHVY